MIIIRFNFNLSIDYNEESKEVTVLSCVPIITSETTNEKTFDLVLTRTMVNYGILLLGSKNSTMLLEKNEEVCVKYNGEVVLAKTHATTTGRIDRLRTLFANNNTLIPGKTLTVSIQVIDAKKYVILEDEKHE